MTGNIRAFQAPPWPTPSSWLVLPEGFAPVTQLTQLSPMTGKENLLSDERSLQITSSVSLGQTNPLSAAWLNTVCVLCDK